MKRKLSFIVFALMLLVLAVGTAKSQIVGIKKWKGTYPDMKGSYPLTFIAFKGKIIPIPHFFIRTWPSHYYYEVISLPVTDAHEIVGQTKTGLLRIAAKMLERLQMKGRYNETLQIKDNTDFQKQIEDKIFNLRSEQLQDLYQLSHQFIQLYHKLDKFGHLPNSSAVKKVMVEETDQLLLRFLMVNLLQTDHGEKLDAFADVRATIIKLQGEVDYTFSKIQFFNDSNQEQISYSFLTQ